MGLRFRYKLESVRHPITSLGGRWVRPRPILSVTLIGPSGSRAKDAVLDTAADDTVFPEALAAKIGIDLTNAPSGSGSGVAMAGVLLRYAKVTLRITDGRQRHEWTAWVAFTSAPMPYPMLGFAGFLQFFSATFHGDHELVELMANTLYPGS